MFQSAPSQPSVCRYKAGANSRGEIAANVFDTGAPKEAWLHYHHEMAYVGSSTRMVAFCCSAAVNDGKGTGSSYISEAQGHTDSILATPLGQKLRELGITYVRCLTDKETGLDDALDNDDSPVYNHWQVSSAAFGSVCPLVTSPAPLYHVADELWRGHAGRSRSHCAVYWPGS